MNVGSNEKVDVYSQYVRTVRLAHDREYSADINRKQKEYYTSLKGSPQHSKMNMLKRQRSKRTFTQMKGSPKYTATFNNRKDVKRRSLYESSFDGKISNFKPLIITPCLYRTSIVCFSVEKCIVDEIIIFMLKSYDDNLIFDRLVIKHCERIVFHIKLLQID